MKDQNVKHKSMKFYETIHWAYLCSWDRQKLRQYHERDP
jgi:hypothetical protein